jgi:hypothetical protein
MVRSPQVSSRGWQTFSVNLPLLNPYVRLARGNEHETARVHHICRKHAAAPFAARAQQPSVSDRTLRQRLARSASTLRFSILGRADEVIEQRGRSVFDQGLFGFD